MTELKPCPFCGGENIETGKTILPGEAVEKWHVGCPDCGVWYDWLFYNENDAAEAWNRRADNEHFD